MDQTKFTRQMLDFNKATFENTFNAIVLLQDQTEKMMAAFLEQATWIPGDGRKAINDWIESVKQGRSEFKKVVDESFSKVEACFAK
jgi:hypothetical protein